MIPNIFNSRPSQIKNILFLKRASNNPNDRHTIRKKMLLHILGKTRNLTKFI